jgi:V/A-type H+-transporting ATPase subunit C
MKLSVLKYAYLNAKVRSMRARLLTKDNIYALLGSKGILEIAQILEKTAYKIDLKSEEINAINLEKIIIKNFIREIEDILNYSPEDVKNLLADLLKKFEIHNLKIILNAKEINMSISDIEQYLLPFRELNEELCKRLMEEAINVEELVELLELYGVSEYREILEEPLEEYRESKLLLPLEVALDKYIYQLLWEDASIFSGVDRKIISELLGTELDVINIKTAIRCKMHKLELENAKKYFLPYGYIFRKEDLERTYALHTLDEMINIFAVYPYREVLINAFNIFKKEESLFPLEVEFEKLLMKMNKRILQKHPSPFNIGIVMSYVNLKWMEIKNLRTIIIGKEKNLPAEKIERILIY